MNNLQVTFMSYFQNFTLKIELTMYRHCSKHLKILLYLILKKKKNPPCRQYYLSFPNLQMGNWYTQKLGNLLKVTQLINPRSRQSNPSVCTSNPWAMMPFKKYIQNI